MNRFTGGQNMDQVEHELLILFRQLSEKEQLFVMEKIIKKKIREDRYQQKNKKDNLINSLAKKAQ